MVKRKAFAFMAAVLLLFTANRVEIYAESFSDIEGHWAEEAILALVELGVLSGRGNGIFDPNGLVTRAEMCVMVNNAFGFERHEYITFDDISPLNFYYHQVSVAISAGYLTGYDDNTVRPGANITRAEAAVIYSKLVELEESPESVERFWDTHAIPAWAKGYIGAVVKAGIMSGYEDTGFLPGKQVTRAEAAASIYAAMYYIPPYVNFIIAEDYGPPEGIETLDGDVTVTASNITLKNLIITGNLIISAEIEGFNLSNVTVEGETYVESEIEE